MKKGDIYYHVEVCCEWKTIVDVNRFVITTINKNGIYLRCIERWCNDRVRVPVGVKLTEKEYHKTKARAMRRSLALLKEHLIFVIEDGGLFEEPIQTKMVQKIRTAITRAEKNMLKSNP